MKIRKENKLDLLFVCKLSKKAGIIRIKDASEEQN